MERELLEAVEGAKTYFNLDLPTTREELKKAYLKASLLLHPDRNLGNEKEAAETFKEMQSIYDLINRLQNDHRNILKDGVNGMAVNSLTTIDGILLASLGKGLGPTTNGRDCKDCSTNGYKKALGTEWVACDKCDDNGQIPKKYRCRPCGGSGTFILKSERCVRCKACKGTGRFTHPHHKENCRSCYGTKMKKELFEENRFVKCGRCDGTGAIEILNPVLRKGALF